MRNKINAIYKLGIATWLSKSMQESKFYKHIDVLIEACWKWVKNKEVSADYLYSLLDDGTEFGGAFIYMQEDDPKFESRWNCIFEAGASISSLAYDFEGKEFKPALLEEIDSEQEEDYFNEQLQDIFGNKIEFLEKYKIYLSSSFDITKEGVLNKLEELLGSM